MSIKTFLKGKNMQFNSETTKGRLIKIFGESTQETRSGKNKFNALLIPSGNANIKVNEDGSIITMPIATSGNGYTNTTLKLSQLAPELKVGDTVFLAFTTTSTKNKFIYLSGVALTWFADTSQTITQEMLDSLVCLYANNYGGGETGTDPVVITNFRMSLGTADLGWEQFGAMPSPEFPSEIESAGKLRNYLHHSAKSANVKGIDYTVLEDGTITAKGTATAKSYFNLLPEGAENYVVPAGTYTLSGCPEGGSASTYVLDINFNSVYYADYGSGVTITLTQDTKIRYCRMIVVAGQTVDLVFKPQLQLGTEIKPFSKDGKFIEYKSIGKNIFDGEFELGIINGNTGVNTSNSSYIRNKNYIPVQELTEYKFSTDSALFTSVNVYEYKEDGTYNLTTNKVIDLSSYLTTNKDTKYIRFRPVGAFTDTNIKVQIKKGIVATGYEPYKESITAIPLLYPMRSLPNGVADTIYYSDGKFYHEQRVSSVTLNGKQTPFGIQVNTETKNTTFCVGGIAYDAKKGVYSAPISNQAKGTTSGAYRNFTNAIVQWADTSASFCLGLSTASVGETTDSIKEWFTNNPMEIQYELAEPIITEISDEIALELLVGYNDLTCDAETWIIYDAERTVFPPIIKITNNGKLEPLGLTIDYNKTNLPLMAEAIEASQTMPGVDGDIVFDTTYGSRIFEITAVTKDYLSPEEKEAEREKVRVLLNSIKNETTKLIIEPLNRTFEVKYAGLAEDNNLPKCVEFVIPLKSAKAYAEKNGGFEHTGDGTITSDTVKSVGFVAKISGEASYPDITINGVQMRYEGVLTAGQTLVIDTSKYTARIIKNSGEIINAMANYNHKFPKLQNGENTIVINNGIEANQLSIEWNDLKL